jgi:sulfate adenylyltransferase (ADP) / ATP adenylyltransferase
MLVMPTIKYAPQTDDLDISDITVAWRVLRAFQTAPHMAIYNCGANAGSSQGHKHLQVFPIPSLMSQALFPSRATSFENIESRISNVTFKHYVLRIRMNDAANDVFDKYQLLLKETRAASAQARTGNDYNVVFTTEWITLIPRRIAILGGAHGANAAGMLGIVAVSSKDERDQWAELGYTKYLAKLGIPRD